MAEISFHRFHMCKGKKQTNIKNAQSNTHSHSSPLPLLPFSDPTTPLLLQLFLSLSQASFCSLLILCVVLHHKTNSKRYFLLYVVDVIERVSNTDYSSNWDWNQLFLNISVICYLKVLISCYNTLYRENFSIHLSCWCSRSRSFILYLRLEHWSSILTCCV